MKRPRFLLAESFAAALSATSFAADAPPGSHQYIVKRRFLFKQPNASAALPIESVIPALGGTVNYDCNEALDPVVAEFLSRLYNRSIGPVNVYSTNLLSSGTAAATVGNNVFISSIALADGSIPWRDYKAHNRNGLALLAHEYRHVLQYRNFPAPAPWFIAAYMLSSYVGTGNWYSDSSYFERPAYRTGDAVYYDATLNVREVQTRAGEAIVTHFDPSYFHNVFDPNSLRGFGAVVDAWLQGYISLEGIRVK